MDKQGESGLETTAIGYLARQIPILGPILYKSDEEVCGEDHWHEQQERLELEGRKKFARASKIALPFALAALVATGAFTFWELYKPRLSRNFYSREGHCLIEKDKKFCFHFFQRENGRGVVYDVTVDLEKNQPKVKSADFTEVKDNTLIGKFSDCLNISANNKNEPAPASYRLQPDSQRYAIAMDLIRESVKEKPELREYCPRELLPKKD